MEDAGIMGVVVVGVGIAGKIRIRDLKDPEFNPDQCWKLIGFISRRKHEIEGVDQLTEEEALTRSDVHAFIICTEPGAHQPLIRKALDNGKNVLVEYPVTISVAAAKELYQLAEQKDLVLHEENIALLSPAFEALEKKLKTLPPVTKAELCLTANYNGWSEDFSKSGLPFIGGISHIQLMYKLFGDLTPTGGRLEVTDKGFTAVGELTTKSKCAVVLTISRFKERVTREKILKFYFEDGTELVDGPEGGPPPKTDSGVATTGPKKPANDGQFIAARWRMNLGKLQKEPMTHGSQGSS
ncbi:hypothetical protein CHS0354_012891 [Potamilus streckersoni]|uniref:Gfo/Idh/MocA-like oxidoreductase N-terminal domain-containing protein n=1 Tax=Potamilus streckersoni TaxID=2493646 RepID=A0AAE0VTE8_9BIVA|nr:hypothetical protein CHS0354_012891 [Potamilus streckersoni]